jgi:hypothetical protein
MEATSMNTYQVAYRESSSAQTAQREFSTLAKAKAWAREYVAESLVGQATAVVFETGNCCDIVRYVNRCGRAEVAA